MKFRIADTFVSSLGRLTGAEQKAVKTTAFDLQVNPAQPGLKFHRLDRAKDKDFWSVRVNRDLRLIVHQTGSSLMLCYVAHHDPAYHWAERRKIERHPRTGSAQIVEVRETIREIEIPRYVEALESAGRDLEPLFGDMSNDDLLTYGVPSEWLDDVRQVTEDSLFDLAEHLPGEAAEALLELATGGKPEISVQSTSDTDPFAHPDAQRRFRVMDDIDDLRQALEYPWDKWTVFLHPAQRALVERDYNGPARAAGSAGTGKTVVALHRAAHLARKLPEARVLLTTFDDPLACALETKLDRLIGHDPDVHARIVVEGIDAVARRTIEQAGESVEIADPETLRCWLRDAAAGHAPRFPQRFLETEWWDVVDAWGLESWEAYRDVPRLGRKTRLGEKQREAFWAIAKAVREQLVAHNLSTSSGAFVRAEKLLAASRAGPPFDVAVVDEAQDIGVAALRFLTALAGKWPNGLFFSGDLGQRIFRSPFSWRALGVDVRGRSHTLRINYRTSHQIRRQADRLMPTEMVDVDGNRDKRVGTVSVFNGSEPQISIAINPAEERAIVVEWLRARVKNGITADEIGVFVRSKTELSRALDAVHESGLPSTQLGRRVTHTSNSVAVGPMHRAKGLEFRAVVVMACDDEILPSQRRIENVADEADLEDVYETERHLLYVACTRARDHLLVAGVTPGSEFLDDFASNPPVAGNQ